MKRLLVSLISVAAIAIVIVIYFVSPLSKSTRHLSVFVEKQEVSPHITGYRTIVVNDGYLPVLVGICRTVNDATGRDIQLGDAIQRWRADNNVWETVLERDDCNPFHTVIERKLSRKLLWPKQCLTTNQFFPNAGIADSPFRHGDRVRFVVFTQITNRNSIVLNSPDFGIE